MSERPKQVCIMGCGRVGAALAERYFNEGYTVYVIDINPEALMRLSNNTLREMAILGNGTESSVLERAQIADAQIFIAVTNGDNRNIMSAQVAQRRYGVPEVICRIYDPMRHETYKRLNVNSICPTMMGAAEIYRVLSNNTSSTHEE